MVVVIIVIAGNRAREQGVPGSRHRMKEREKVKEERKERKRMCMHVYVCMRRQKKRLNE